MKVYIVECGEYSDMGIEAVFSTREKAEEFIKYHEYSRWFGDFRISEYNLDSWNKEDYIYEYICDIDEDDNLDEKLIQTIEHKFSADINTNACVCCHRFHCFSRNVLDIKEINDKYQKFRAEEMGL